MFTGIVESIGSLTVLQQVGERVDLEIEVTQELTEGVDVGDSVALNGCCLTVTQVEPGRLAFQAIPETLRKTSLGARKVGDRVNVERAMRVDDRLDGHIVQGHVDGTGSVQEMRRAGEDVLLRIDCGPEISNLLVQKGSITVDGVSLTVVDPDPGGFQVALIPHTLEATNLDERKPGDPVNLEVDVLGKYVFSYLEKFRSSPG